MSCRSSGLFAFAIAATSCIDIVPGTSVEVSVAAVSSSNAARDELVNDTGYHLQLNQMYLVLSRVELVPCSGTQRVSVLRELFGPARAHAHGVNTRTAWTVPNVLAPLADDVPVSIAVLHPPALAYCSLRVALEAADADVERMPSEIDMNGRSMFMTGSYRSARGGPRVSFQYESIVASTMELPIVDSAGNAAPIVLSHDNLDVQLRLEIAYQQMFDGLTPYPGAFSSFGDVVLSQALTHTKVFAVSTTR